MQDFNIKKCINIIICLHFIIFKRVTKHVCVCVYIYIYIYITYI